MRSSLVTAGDKRVAAGEPAQAVANYDKALADDPDPDVQRKRDHAARLLVEKELAEAREVAEKGEPAKAFVAIRRLKRAGAYGASMSAELDRAMEPLVKSLWEEMDTPQGRTRPYALASVAAGLAFAFEPGHWTHQQAQEHRRARAEAHTRRAAQTEGLLRQLHLATAALYGAPGATGPAPAELLRKVFGVEIAYTTSAAGECSAVRDQLGPRVSELSTAGANTKLEVRFELVGCNVLNRNSPGTRTERYKVQVPYEVEREVLEREEWGSLGGQTSSPVTDARGNKIGTETRAIKGQTTYRLVKRKKMVTEYREEVREREVAATDTEHEASAWGTAVIGAGSTAERNQLLAKTRRFSQGGASETVDRRDAESLAPDLFAASRVAAAVDRHRAAVIDDLRAQAQVARDAGELLDVAVLNIALYGSGDEKAKQRAFEMLEGELGFLDHTIEQILAGDRQLRSPKIEPLTLPEAESTRAEHRAWEEEDTTQRRRRGPMLAGVDAAYHVRRSPLREPGQMRSVGSMSSIEVGGRGELQGGFLSIGAKALGGKTSGFLAGYAIRIPRESGAALVLGAVIGGETLLDANQHTTMGLILGYLQPLGPTVLDLRIDPNLIQIFKGTGVERDVLHLTPASATLEVPIGPMFVRGGGVYFVGGPDPLGFEVALGARFVIGE